MAERAEILDAPFCVPFKDLKPRFCSVLALVSNCFDSVLGSRPVGHRLFQHARPLAEGLAELLWRRSPERTFFGTTTQVIHRTPWKAAKGEGRRIPLLGSSLSSDAA